jgi:hypothetical protein
MNTTRSLLLMYCVDSDCLSYTLFLGARRLKNPVFCGGVIRTPIALITSGLHGCPFLLMRGNTLCQGSSLPINFDHRFVNVACCTVRKT